MGIKIPTLYLILLIEFALILLGLAAFLFLRRLKLKKRHSPSIPQKDDLKTLPAEKTSPHPPPPAKPVEKTLEEKPKEEIPKEEKAAPPGEKEELLKKIADLEKMVGEKDQKIASLEKTYASLEKEYQILYEQQAETEEKKK